MAVFFCDCPVQKMLPDRTRFKLSLKLSVFIGMAYYFLINADL